MPFPVFFFQRKASREFNPAENPTVVSKPANGRPYHRKIFKSRIHKCPNPLKLRMHREKIIPSNLSNP